ncbi:helix-turn-helix domain-containing protein [Mucilaginibacter litoreus]|uniref:Helix-turn-helix domain-containing protein n=1 Tax=Mucilaginibacter litoreus TaxID=1048221 RepID=A0ABW3AS55_9SPHI
MKSQSARNIEAIIQNIRKAREDHNYTQEYMAMRMKCSQNAYSKLELGYSKLTVENLLKVCEVLEIDVNEVVNIHK